MALNINATLQMRIRGNELVWDVLNVTTCISALITPRTSVSVAAALVLTALSSVVRADADFENWLKQLGIDAQKQGISQSTLDGALAGLQLDLSLQILSFQAGR
jgi:membrane-bound lytic murein transglycosylase B